MRKIKWILAKISLNLYQKYFLKIKLSFFLFWSYMFCNCRSFFIKNFTPTIWTLYSNIFNIKFDTFFTNATSITAHIKSTLINFLDILWWINFFFHYFIKIFTSFSRRQISSSCKFNSTFLTFPNTCTGSFYLFLTTTWTWMFH